MVLRLLPERLMGFGRVDSVEADFVLSNGRDPRCPSDCPPPTGETPVVPVAGERMVSVSPSAMRTTRPRISAASDTPPKKIASVAARINITAESAVLLVERAARAFAGASPHEWRARHRAVDGSL